MFRRHKVFSVAVSRICCCNIARPAAADALFLALLVISPLVFGAVYPVSCAMVASVCLLLPLIDTTGSKGLYRKALSSPVVWGILVVVALGMLQAMPFPKPLLKALSPEACALYDRYLPGWAARSISVYPHATIRNVLLFAPFAAMAAWLSVRLRAEEPTLSFDPAIPAAAVIAFAVHSCVFSVFRIPSNLLYLFTFGTICIASLSGRGGTFANVIARTVIATGTAIAVLALVQAATFNGRLYWIGPAPHDPSAAVGPFFNRGHFAGFIVFPLMLAFGLSLPVSGDRHMQRARIFYALAATVMLLSLIVSRSRGGVLAVLVAGGALALIRALRTRRPYPIAFSALWLAIVSAFVALWMVNQPILERVPGVRAMLRHPEQRVMLWRDTSKMVRDFPLTGTGWGTFRSIFSKYRIWAEDPSGQSAQFHPASSVIEFIAEFGICGVVMLIVFIFAAVRVVILSARGLP